MVYMIMIGFPTIVITVTKENLSTTLAISLNNPTAILNTIVLGIYIYIYTYPYYIPILSLLLLIQDPEKSWFDASMIALELFL